MSWQSKIYHKYRLDEKGVKIIADHTGLLVHSSFLDYLKNEHKSYVVADSAPGMVDHLSNEELVILANKVEIPSFIENQHETYNFHFTDIPVNGDPNILAKITTKDIVKILSFVDTTGRTKPINSSNLHTLLEQARRQKKRILKSTLKKIMLCTSGKRILNQAKPLWDMIV